MPSCAQAANQHLRVLPPLPPLLSIASLQARSKDFLQAELGPKLGAQLWDYAHGQDDRWVPLSFLLEAAPQGAASWLLIDRGSCQQLQHC